VRRGVLRLASADVIARSRLAQIALQVEVSRERLATHSHQLSRRYPYQNR
jgi:hypothetical protein